MCDRLHKKCNSSAVFWVQIQITLISCFGLLAGGCLGCVRCLILIKGFSFVCPADLSLTQLVLPLWSGTMLVQKSLVKLFFPVFVRVLLQQDSNDSLCSSLFCQLISLRTTTQGNIILKGASNEYLAGEKANSPAPHECVTVVTAVWGLIKSVSFHSLGETFNELVFLSDCVFVVLYHDVLLGQITQSKSSETDVMFMSKYVKMSASRKWRNQVSCRNDF